MNLAAAGLKILFIVAFRAIFIWIAVHEINLLRLLLTGQFSLVVSYILAKPNVVLLEKIVVVQRSAAHDAVLLVCGIGVFSNRVNCSSTPIKGQKVVGR